MKISHVHACSCLWHTYKRKHIHCMYNDNMTCPLWSGGMFDRAVFFKSALVLSLGHMDEVG